MTMPVTKTDAQAVTDLIATYAPAQPGIRSAREARLIRSTLQIPARDMLGLVNIRNALRTIYSEAIAAAPDQARKEALAIALIGAEGAVDEEIAARGTGVSSIRIDAEAVRAVIAKHRPAKFGVLSQAEQAMIQSELQLGTRSDTQLRNIRDAAVALYGEKIRREPDAAEQLAAADAMGGVTGAIDAEMARRGIAV